MQINDVKKLLHTYRCLLMAIHLMRTGEMLMDVPQLAEQYQMPQLQRLIKYKLSGVEGLEKSEIAMHDLVLFGLHKMLDIAVERSHLPKETPEKTRKELEALLIRVRTAELARK
jgi:predicted nucleotidyltransferase